MLDVQYSGAESSIVDALLRYKTLNVGKQNIATFLSFLVTFGLESPLYQFSDALFFPPEIPAPQLQLFSLLRQCSLRN